MNGKYGCVSFGFIWTRPVDNLKAELTRNRQDMNLAMYESEDEALRYESEDEALRDPR